MLSTDKTLQECEYKSSISMILLRDIHQTRIYGEQEGNGDIWVLTQLMN